MENNYTRETIYKINDLATQFYQEQLKKSKEAQEYLKQRNINKNSIKEFKIGYARDDNSLYKYLKEQGYTYDVIIEAGLCCKTENGDLIDRYRNRIIFPIINEKNKVVAFGGRAIDNSIQKYINGAETTVYSKAQNLYGITISKDYAQNGIIIVEGYIDLISLNQVGVKNVVALLGTAITDEQIKLIKKYTNKVILTFDSDLAGQQAALKIGKKLKLYDIDYWNIKLENAKDVDEFINKYGIDEFKKLLQNDDLET